jgi:hypothetical protein
MGMELGARGREYVFENLGWSKIAEKVERVYREAQPRTLA